MTLTDFHGNEAIFFFFEKKNSKMGDSKKLSFSIPPILMNSAVRLHGKKLQNATKIINPKLGDNESDKLSSHKKVKKQNTKGYHAIIKIFLHS